jgi:putative aldouronate transport system permease protein
MHLSESDNYAKSYSIKSMKLPNKFSRVGKYKYLYLLMVPGILWYIFFHIWPLYGIVIAFQDFLPYQGFFGSEWVGLKHFNTLFSSSGFSDLLINTVYISFMKLLAGFPAPIILALLINEVKNNKIKRFVQSASYLPNFISWVIVTGIIFAVFNSYYGLLMKFCETIGIPYTDISTNRDYFVAFLVMTSVWKSAGMGSIIYLAAISSIDSSLYEAAIVDGAGRWKQMFYITIPSIVPICAIVFILSVGSLLSGDFEQIYLFAKENIELIKVSEVFETYVYRNGILMANFSFPAAVGIFQSFFAAMLVLITNSITKKLGYEGIW